MYKQISCGGYDARTQHTQSNSLAQQTVHEMRYYGVCTPTFYGQDQHKQMLQLIVNGTCNMNSLHHAYQSENRTTTNAITSTQLSKHVQCDKQMLDKIKLFRLTWSQPVLIVCLLLSLNIDS